MGNRLIKQLIVKVDGDDAKKAWKGRLHLRSPKILIPAEFVSGVKDAILLQHTLKEKGSAVNSKIPLPLRRFRTEPIDVLSNIDTRSPFNHQTAVWA